MKIDINTAGMLSIVASALLVTACADPKAANEANFRKVLEPSVAKAFCRPLTTPLRLTEATDDRVDAFPLAVVVESGGNDRVRDLLEAAAKGGLLIRKEQTLPATGRVFGFDLTPRKVVTFEPSEKGKAVFLDVPNASGRAPQATVCLGTGKIDKIVRWTEPAEIFGRRVTNVSYTYSAADIPAALPADMRDGLTTPKDAEMALIQTSDGWQIAQ